MLLTTADPVLLSNWRALLSGRCTCLSAASAAQAHQILQKEPVKAMLLADPLPDGNGIEFIRTAHRLKPEIKTVLLTEQTDINLIITAFNEGCIFRCLQLPAAPETLAKAAKDALRRYEMDRVQQKLADHAKEIDQYLHSVPYWLHRLETILSQSARSLTLGTGLILGSSLLILLFGAGVLLLLYFLKSILGFDFFDTHLSDFFSGAG
ncbi:MAG: response regulator [Kiritimatiellales bacterium]